jgi:sugar phosphate permease
MLLLKPAGWQGRPDRREGPQMTGAVIPRPMRREAIRDAFWRRQLPHYPSDRMRALYLALIVLITIQLYYQNYIGSAVATQIIDKFDLSLTNFILIGIAGNALGAFASLSAGLADRWGRANMVLVGLLVTTILALLVFPAIDSKAVWIVTMVSTNFFEGMILVATPALIRDFSPQLGRASAMGFWTLGPVIGSLTVTSVASATLPSHPDWQFQFRLCGVVGVFVFVLAFVGLRELSARLRDQLMVSVREKVLVEARAAGIDPDQALRGSWRQMLKLDVVGPAFAISIFLLFYYILVGFFVVYYALTFGYTEARANSLANWYWGANAIALVAVGLGSDKLRVRKPFMVGGALLSAGGVAAFALLTTHQSTGYYTFAWLLALIAVGNGVAYCGWMAAFTETVERHNPAATATGLAVWGGILRSVVTVSLIGLIFVVPSARVLVDHGPEVRTITTTYATEIATLNALSPGTRAALAATPGDPAAGGTAVAEIIGAFGVDQATAVARLRSIGRVPAADLAYLRDHGPAVAAAQRSTRGEWQRWWWICSAAQLIFIPFCFLLAGRWSPRRAAEDARARAALVDRELAELATERGTNAVSP